jgi:hypothetical protein
MRWLCDKSLASSQALPPGRVPHVRRLSRTWVEDVLFPMLSPPGLHLLTGKERGRASPGFPVEFGGVGESHAAFLIESRTRCRRPVPRIRKSGSPIFSTHVRESPRTWGTRPGGKACEEAGKAEDRITNAKVGQLFKPSRTPDFLPRCSQKRPRMRLSLRKAA